MNWKKRKRLRRIAHSHGFKHYYHYNRTCKFCIRVCALKTSIANGECSWYEILPRLNRLLTYAGHPEKCMSQREWWQRIEEIHRRRAELEDEAIRHFLDNYSYQSNSLSQKSEGQVAHILNICTGVKRIQCLTRKENINNEMENKEKA